MKSLKFNRVILFTLLVAVVSLATGLLVLTKVRNQLVDTSKQEYQQQQAMLAGQIVETLTNNLINVENQLRVMATISEVQDIDNVEQCNAKLTELLEINQKQLGNLGRTDPAGIFACSVNPAIIGHDSRQYGPYVEQLINDPEHKPVMGRKATPAGADTLAVSLHVPVYQNGEFRGTLGGAMYLNKFQDTYLRNIQFGKSGHVVLMDDAGDILYHPDKAQSGKNLLDPEVLKLFEPESTMRKLLSNVQAGKSGEFRYSVNGLHKFGLYNTFELPDIDRKWAVVVTIPEEDLESAVNEAGIDTIFAVLVSLFVLTTALLTFVSLMIIHKNLEVSKMKDDFISITSHQLRTPATIVKQNLGLIRGGFATSKKDVDRFIDSAYESNENQLSVIENILSVSKLEAGKLEINKEQIVLQDVINRLAENIKLNVAARKHKLTLKLPGKPIELRADPLKMNMAIENLVSNSVKYTPPGGKITVEAQETGDNVRIIVSDNGRGIAAEDIPKLFLRFNRLHSAVNSHVPGTGLGLYLTKKIIELHGGTITVSSQDNKGSEFTITLPKE